MTKSIRVHLEVNEGREREGAKKPFFKRKDPHSRQGMAEGVMFNMAKSIARNHFKLLVDKNLSMIKCCVFHLNCCLVVCVRLMRMENFVVLCGGDEDLFQARSTVKLNILNLPFSVNIFFHKSPPFFPPETCGFSFLILKVTLKRSANHEIIMASSLN